MAVMVSSIVKTQLHWHEHQRDITDGYWPAVVAPLILFLQVGGRAGARGTGARGHVPSQDGG